MTERGARQVVVGQMGRRDVGKILRMWGSFGVGRKGGTAGVGRGSDMWCAAGTRKCGSGMGEKAIRPAGLAGRGG